MLGKLVSNSFLVVSALGLQMQKQLKEKQRQRRAQLRALKKKLKAQMKKKNDKNIDIIMKQDSLQMQEKAKQLGLKFKAEEKARTELAKTHISWSTPKGEKVLLAKHQSIQNCEFMTDDDKENLENPETTGSMNIHLKKFIQKGKWGSVFQAEHNGKQYAVKVIMDKLAFTNPQMQDQDDAAHGLAWEWRIMKKHILKNNLAANLQKKLHHQGHVSYIQFHALGMIDLPISEEQKEFLQNKKWQTRPEQYTEEQIAWLNDNSNAMKLPPWTKNVLVMELVTGLVDPTADHLQVWNAVKSHQDKIDVLAQDLKNNEFNKYYFDADRYVSAKVLQKGSVTYSALNIFCLWNDGKPELKFFDFGLWNRNPSNRSNKTRHESLGLTKVHRTRYDSLGVTQNSSIVVSMEQGHTSLNRIPIRAY